MEKLEWPEGPAPVALKQRLVDAAYDRLCSRAAVATATRPMFVLIPYPPAPVDPPRLEAELQRRSEPTDPIAWCFAWRDGAWAVATFDAPLFRELLFRFLEARVSDLIAVAVSDPGPFHPEGGRVAELVAAIADEKAPSSLGYAGLVFDWGQLVDELEQVPNP